MKYGKIIALAYSHRDKNKVLKSGDPIKETDVYNIEDAIKQGFVQEISEDEYKEIYLEKNGQKVPEPVKTEDVTEEEDEPVKTEDELKAEELRETEDYKALIKLNKEPLQVMLKDKGFLGEIPDEWKKDELVIKILDLKEGE